MSQQQMRLSCLACKAKKQKCDRIFPSCSRCLRAGVECEFPRSRRSQVARPMRVQDLQNKLVMLEDEIASLKKADQTSHDNDQTSDPIHEIISVNPPATPLAALSPSVLFHNDSDTRYPLPADPGLDPDVVLELTNAYFEGLAYAIPIIHRGRYMASLSRPPEHQPPSCLQYIIMALGAHVSYSSPSLAKSLYQTAKAHAMSKHLEDDEEAAVTLSYTQCWTLIANFEALQMMFTQALISLLRGIRTAQALGYHHLDQESDDSGPARAQTRIILEEKRRTWWFLFMSDRLVCGTTGLPLCIDQEDVTTLLPMSEETFIAGTMESTSPWITLPNITILGPSILGIRVYVANLFHQTMDHVSHIESGAQTKEAQHDFWDCHRRIDNELTLCSIKLPENARIGNPIHNRDAAIINTELQAAIISLRRGATWKLRFAGGNLCGEEIKREQARRSKERVMNSAQEIAHILRVAGAYPATFMNPILIFTVYLAALAFIEDYLDRKKEESQDTAVMFLSALVTIGVRNIVAKSLAKQVAKDMSYVGMEIPPDLNTQALVSDVPSLFSADVGVAAVNVLFRSII